MFGGYARYRHLCDESALAAPLSNPARAAARAAIRSQVATTPLLSSTLRRKLQHTFVGRGEDLESPVPRQLLFRFLRRPTARSCSTSLPAPSPYANFRKYWDSKPGSPGPSRALFADQKTYLVELLMKQDQMSMATSIESRVPFLDHEFVEFSTRVPAAHEATRWRGQVHRQRRPSKAWYPTKSSTGRRWDFPLRCASGCVTPRRAPLPDHARQGWTAGVLHRLRRARQPAAPSGRRPRRCHRPHLAPAHAPAMGRHVPYRQTRRVLGWCSWPPPVPPYEDPVGQLQFHAPHHQGRTDPHSGDAAPSASLA